MKSGAGIKFKKRDVDRKNIVTFCRTLDSMKISVGVHKEQGQHNFEKAILNEFGFTYVIPRNVRKRLSTGKYITLRAGTRIVTPVRPFVRIYLYPEVVSNINQYLKSNIDDAYRAKLKAPVTNAKNTLINVANFSEEQMKKIADETGNYQPNAGLTIAIKGFDKPLYKTGKMINAIKGKVKKRIER